MTPTTTNQPSTGVTAVAPAAAPAAAPPGRSDGASHRDRPKPRLPTTARKWLVLAGVIIVGIAGYLVWSMLQPEKLPAGFASSNGRIEATEVDIATKIHNRLMEVLKDEGDFVTAGQVLAQMDTDELKAQLREAEAELRKAKSTVETALSTVAQRVSEKEAAEATVLQRDAEFDLAVKNWERAKPLAEKSSIAKEELDTYRAAFYKARAAVATAKANVAAASAAIATAKSLVTTAEANVIATQAKIDRVHVDITDCTLKAPRDGRVQYRIAQPGEVLSAGGKVLNMVDLGDVYMTFFLPTDWAGRVKMGAEARIVLDAAPQFVIPARVTFVADVAQFTPKTVETAEERQKLTFRIKAHIEKDILRKYIRDVKTGLPGVAYVQLDPQARWPARLEVKLPD
jgi:HlyD family secretion protein